MRVLGSQAERVNDVFTLCEKTHYAYQQATQYCNIVNGFHAVG